MKHADFLTRIADPAGSVEERLTLLAQFVFVNGFPGPDSLMDHQKLPTGYVFRTSLLRDLCVCLAVPRDVAKSAPKGAMADSAQLWQFALTEDGIDRARCGVVCTLNGAVTKVTTLDSELRAHSILQEWTEEPPTEVELAPPPVGKVHLQ